MISQEVALSEICDTGSGGTPSRAKQDIYYGGSIPWVKSGELRESIITETGETLTDLGLRESAAKLLPPNTLLVALYGATVGRVGMLGIEAATNQAVCYLIPDDTKVNRRYLYHALRSKVPYWLTQRVGGGQPNISQGVIKNTKIPLPPLSEQKRIAEILDRAEALRAKRRAALALLDELTQAIFLDMFGDPVSNPMGWEDAKTLGDIANVRSGITKGRRTKDPVRTVPYLAVVNVQDKLLDLSVVKTIDATEKEIGRYQLKTNDLLLTEGGDADKLGRGTLWQDELPECIHQNHIFCVRLETEDVSPLFLNWLVGGARGKSYFLRQAKQTTGIATINMTQLKSFPMLIPPLQLQTEFVKRVSRSEHMRSVQMKALSELDQLFASLQNRAFRGEL